MDTKGFRQIILLWEIFLQHTESISLVKCLIHELHLWLGYRLFVEILHFRGVNVQTVPTPCTTKED